MNDYYSRISVLGPEGHCTSCFNCDVHFSQSVDGMWISTRRRGQDVDACGQGRWREGQKPWAPCGCHK